ncbi:MAG: purine-nucleoside phosphorylase [Faecalibacillus sp.]
MHNQINQVFQYIYAQYSKPIDVAIILGSGLGSLTKEIKTETIIKYQNIPHFPVSTVKGHEGQFIIGKIEDKTVIAMQGRFHYYEGYDMEQVTLPIRIFSKLKIPKLIVTNACGGIRDDLDPGDLVCINDQIGLFCPSPLRGPNLDEFGPRFKDMTEIYDKGGQKLLHEVANALQLPLKDGIYCFFKGPMFESPAEIRAIKAIGGDLAGMSTVPEAIVARHCGIKTVGISLVTNKAAGLSKNELSHQEVMDTAKDSEKHFSQLIKEFIKKW